MSHLRWLLGLLCISSLAFSANKILPLSDARAKLGIPEYTAEDRQRLADQAALFLKELFVHREVKAQDFGAASDPTTKIEAIQKKAKDLSNEELHNSIAKIFSDLHDLHTNYIAPAPRACGAAFVPMVFQIVTDGKSEAVLLARTLKLNAEVAELVKDVTVGDELLEVDGVAISKVLADLSSISGGSNPDAMQVRSAQMLSIRNLATQPIPEKDSVVFTMSGKDGQYKKDIPWQAFLSEECLRVNDWKPKNPFNWRWWLFNEMNRGEDEFQKRYNQIFGNPGLVKADPTWGKVDNFKDIFEMALLETPAGKLGYVQLKAFSWNDRSLDVTTVIEGFRNEIETHLSEARGLIIDVRGNPGGIITLAEKLPQLFSPKEVHTTKLRMLANPLNEKIFLKANGTENRWTDAIRAAMKAGKRYMDPMPLTPDKEANSFGQIWFRPVIVLTDAACYSACDVFSSLMQDMGAGVIIGIHKTTGAGGANVMEHKTFRAIMGQSDKTFEPLPFKQNMRVSWRQVIRSGKHDGKLLEDKGVESDIVVPLTKSDVGTASKTLMRTINEIITKLAPNYKSGLAVRKGGDVLLKNGDAARWKEKVFGVDSIDVLVEGKKLSTIVVPFSESEKEVEFSLDSLSNQWTDRPITLVGKLNGKPTFRSVRELMWRGDYSEIPEKGLEVSLSDKSIEPFHTVLLRGSQGTGWQVSGELLRVGKGPKYDSNVLTRAFLPVKVDGKGGQLTLDIALQAESASDSLRFYFMNPDTGERYHIYAGSSISPQSGVNIPIPMEWNRADIVFEFESDENWNMIGPLIRNVKLSR